MNGRRYAVIIPWRDVPDRRGPLAWVLDRWAAHPDVRVVLGEHPESAGPWCKAAAVADGLRQVPDADVIAVHDADVWSDRTVDAFVAVDDRGDEFHRAWAIPHTMVHRLTPAATAVVLAGGDLWHNLPTVQHPYGGVPGGGIVVLPAAVYEQVPLDPRFEGWGQEDESWGLALERLVGSPWRSPAPLWHLWHEPPAPRTPGDSPGAYTRLNRHVGNRGGHALHHRYLQARTPDTMRRLIDEFRVGV